MPVTEVEYVGGKMVKLFASEPVRDLGPLRFLLDLRLWAGILVAGVVLWFLFVKMVN